jgi:acyl-[acyl-carrier-protein]-phospholipid O-acyltransferase/long-chain-fatty-acid--[acyl-carrier-protein] ligase
MDFARVASWSAVPWLLPAFVVLAAVAAMLWHGPVAQLPHYHEFADRRSWLGIPNAADVLSNLGFALVGVLGLALLWQNRASPALQAGRQGYALFFASLVLTTLGSGWYHLAPDDARLLWDRLPIALACAGLLAAVWRETVGGDRRIAPLLAASALGSVFWWRYTALRGDGDLGPYLLLQLLPLVLVPLLHWQHHVPSAERRVFALALGMYVLAKCLELADHATFAALTIVSGHTLKHVLATLAAVLIWWSLRQRLVGRRRAQAPGAAAQARSDGQVRCNWKVVMRSVFRVLLRWICQVLFRVRVDGRMDNVDARRLLIIANHESFLDGLLLGLFLPVDPVFVVHTGVTRQFFFRLALHLVDYLAVDPTSPMAMKKVIKLLEAGRPVVIFPEGRITDTGSLMKVYDGPAFVAAKTGATVLPVRIDGPSRSFFGRISGKNPRRLLPKVTISILPPTSIPMPVAGTAKMRRRRAGEDMRRLMQKMIFDAHPKQTLFSELLDTMRIYGPRRRVVEDLKQIEYSYRDLLKMSLALGRIVSKNSAPDECIGILMPNLAATVCLMIGTSALGRVPAMLNYKAGAGGMRDACVAAAIRTVFASRVFIEQAKLEADVAGLIDAGGGVRVLYLEDLQPQLGLWDKIWILAAMQFPAGVERQRDPKRAAVVLFTSGSEGRPKGVVLSHHALLSNIAQIRAIIDFSAEDKVLNALPIFHSFGLTGGALLPILTGMNLFLYPSPLHYRVIPEIAYDRNCSVMFGTNTFLANYAKFAHPYDFFRLRYVVAGAEKLSESVRSLWFEKFGIRILEGYGATETAPVLAVNTPMAYRTGSVGQLLPSIEHRLLPVPGIERGGILHVRGPNLMSGYYRYETPGKLHPPASAAGDGWYETGDVVDIDEDGFLSIVGRLKRFAKVAGEMVSLEVVEKVAGVASPGQTHGASTQTDGARGEAIVLFSTDAGLSRDRLAEAAKSLGVPELAVPRKILHLDALPLLGTGKVDYVSLKKLCETAI